nr:hypothetical protein [Tanacetum cinerariifolium]
MASSSNRRGAAETTLPWTITEEITLCTAWCNAMDTYVTRDIQFSKGIWEEVYANFKKDIGGTIRGYDDIVSKRKILIRPKEKADEQEICPYLTEKGYHQLLIDEAAFKEHLEEEAKAEKERAIYDKELEEFLKAGQAHDELFMMEFVVKSDSEY